MEGIDRGDDFEPAFVMAEFARQFEQTFVRLRAAVAEENFARGQISFDDRLRQPALRLVVIEIRDVDELLRLLDERLGDLRIRMAERSRPRCRRRDRGSVCRRHHKHSCPRRG